MALPQARDDVRVGTGIFASLVCVVLNMTIMTPMSHVCPSLLRVHLHWKIAAPVASPYGALTSPGGDNSIILATS
jgi:hypothetical protein